MLAAIGLLIIRNKHCIESGHYPRPKRFGGIKDRML